MDTSDVIVLEPVREVHTGQVVYRGPQTDGRALVPLGTRTQADAALTGPGVEYSQDVDVSPQIINGELVTGASEATPLGQAVTLTDDRFAAAGPLDWATAERAQDAGFALQIVNGELVPVGGKPAESGQAVTLTDDRFAVAGSRARGRLPRRHRLWSHEQAVDSGTGTQWAITDVALEVLDRELAVPVPERGAALIADRESRLIIGAVVDRRPGEPLSYWHSDQLREELATYLAGNPGHRYVGTVHSHPAGYAEPSGQDLKAFTNMLAANSQIGEAIFPIVVGQHRSSMTAALRLGSEHLVDLTHGTLAGYSAHPQADGLIVRPAPIHVVPAAAHCREAALALGSALGMPVEFRWGSNFSFAGTGWLTAYFTIDGRNFAGAALCSSYPLTPPMVWRADSPKPMFPAWPGAATGAVLAEVLTGLCLSAGREVADTADVIRAGIRERLEVHLPQGIRHRVLVVGAGSVGSNAAEMLVRSGVRRLTVVDFDTVAPANLSRTVYTGTDLGQAKTKALRQRLISIAPDLDLRLIEMPLQELTGDQFDQVDLAFLASDDLAGEGWLNHQLYSRSVPFVSVKLFAGAEGAELAYVDPTRDTACLRCMMGSLGSAERGEVDYGTGRIHGSPALGPDIVAATARGVKVALALTQDQGPLRDWLDQLTTRRLTYFLSANVPGWKYTEFAHPGSLPFDGIWLSAPGTAQCEICGADRVPAACSSGIAELSAEPPSWGSATNGDGLVSPAGEEREEQDEQQEELGYVDVG